MSSVAAGNVVRIVSVLNSVVHEHLFAHVLNVQPAAEGDMPNISVAYMIPRLNPAVLGSSNWSQAFIRQAGVPHSTHPEVLRGEHSVYWIDVLPTEWPDLDEHPTLPIPGPSAVYSRDRAEEFFSQNARRVPGKVEPVVEGVTVDHTQETPENTAVVPSEPAADQTTV